MGAPGQPKDLGSGRQKGTPNKKTQDLMEICQRHGLDPFEGMVLLAIAEENTDKKFDRLKEIAQYLYPKRKAIEHSGAVEGIEVTIRDYTKKESEESARKDAD